ncbi:hypothetical protein DMENIID0001_148410 [Sergentomyia squamirostris]
MKETPSGHSELDGIHKGDQFQYKVKPRLLGKTSRRTILLDEASIFDPIGWLAPIVFEAKLLMQPKVQEIRINQNLLLSNQEQKHARFLPSG